MQPGDWVTVPFATELRRPRFGQVVTTYWTAYWTSVATYPNVTLAPAPAGPGEVYAHVRWLTSAGTFYYWQTALHNLSPYTPTEQDLADWLVAELTKQ